MNHESVSHRPLINVPLSHQTRLLLFLLKYRMAVTLCPANMFVRAAAVLLGLAIAAKTLTVYLHAGAWPLTPGLNARLVTPLLV